MPELRVVATAGHVDHGKSSLIQRLTGMDPDRLEEEKRRGLTIDLGFAWCELPSGREIGFVDVPGHERFVRNMLAGIGPVRRVLFVVAADEGWKPQSEEHLQIVDLLGGAGVVALTKIDLVDAETRELATQEVSERLAGTVLERAPVVACSSFTGEGLEDLRTALDALVTIAEPAQQEPAARSRLFVDRVFSIKGAGTVVTGTLDGGAFAVGDEVTILPAGHRARVRGLQTHKRSIPVARPVSRVAMNLTGVERERLQRGDVIGHPGEWRATATFEGRMRPIRGLDHALTGRGAYKLYAGSSEVDARIRLYGDAKLEPDGSSFVRIRAARPLALDLFDGFVLREAGRRETVAGGRVLDVEPPRRSRSDPARRLAAREGVPRDRVVDLLAEERGAIRVRDARVLTGAMRASAGEDGAWIVAPELRDSVRADLSRHLSAFHAGHPLLEGEELGTVRTLVSDILSSSGAPADPGLVDQLLDALVARGTLVRTASLVRLAAHHVSLDERADELRPLLDAIEAEEPTPPTVPELIDAGFSREMIDAAGRGGQLVRISNDLALRSQFVSAAEEAVRKMASEGAPITVSAFRERVGTSRKYALPLLEHFDRTGLTRREGDLRHVRET